MGQRIDYLSPTLYMTDIFIFGLFLTTLWKKQLKISPLFVFFSLYFALSAFFSSYPLAGWYGFFRFLEMSFFTYMVSILLPKKEKTVGILFSIGIFLESVLAFAQYVLQSSVGGLLYFLGERTFSGATPGIANVSIFGQLILRPYATFPHPNVLGGYLLLGMIMVYFFLQTKKEWWVKILLILSIGIGTLGLLLTFSRTAILLWGFVVIGFLIFKKYSLRIKGVILGGITLLSTSLFVFSPVVLERFMQLKIDESVTYREELARVALKMIEKHPFFGIGLNNFIPTLPQYSAINFLQPVHNIVLLLTSEIGLVGLFFVAGFTLYFFRSFVKSLKQNALLTPLLAALFCFFVIGMLDHYFFTMQQGQLLTAFLIGTVLHYSSENPA
jgi:O-antigen ligase